MVIGVARGQLSLELLAAFAIFLSLLAISYFASQRLAASVSSRLQSELASSSFARLSSAAARTCSLGSGNVRTVEIIGEPASLSEAQGAVIFAAGNFSARLESACPLSVLQPGPSQSFRVENNDGTVELS